MSKYPTTIRLDKDLYKKVQRQAEKEGLSFSNVVHLLLHAFTQGEVQIGVTQYPPGYLEKLGEEADELREQYKKGKVKTFASAKEMFDDILDR